VPPSTLPEGRRRLINRRYRRCACGRANTRDTGVRGTGSARRVGQDRGCAAERVRAIGLTARRYGAAETEQHYNVDTTPPNVEAIGSSRLRRRPGLQPSTAPLMSREQALALLASASDAAITEGMLARTPWIFAGDADKYQEWRERFAEAAICSPEGVYVVGSAMFGFSVSPEKAGRDFRRGGHALGPSDIDVVVVSDTLFEVTWDVLREAESRGGLGATREDRDKVRTDVYWGHVTSVTIPKGTGPARLLLGALGLTTARQPFRGHPSLPTCVRQLPGRSLV
jgi:hypothetical protein